MKLYRSLIIIIVIVAVAVWIDLPSSTSINLFGIKKDIRTSLGLDLVGGVQVLLEADLPAGSTASVNAASMDTARRIVENRVNGLGVSEAVVQRVGQNRIGVEIPGESNPEEAIATIKKTGLLEFVDFSDVTAAEANALFTAKTPITTDFGQAVTTTQTTQPVSVTQRTYHTVMTGVVIKTVAVQPNQSSGFVIAFELNSEGAQIFKDYTSTHVGKILAIVLDKVVISYPSINSAITEGKGIVEGRFTQDTANQLAIQLRYGSLPIPLKVIKSSTVGPTLGQDSLRRSLIAGGIGLGMVILFMAFYYRLPGVLADLALIVYALITFAIFRFLPITLTLPGIAGFVLSIGMAVDANVLIFERLKEELRAGKTLRTAIDMGWSRAWSSIRDSNSSTLITCLILFWFGSTFGASIVKGFALTLAIGVLISLFTAIIVTRTFLHLLLDSVKAAEHPRWFGV